MSVTSVSRVAATRAPARPNGTITVSSSGMLGWFLALTSGLPRHGELASHLELRTGPQGQRWTRHLRAGRRLTPIRWVDGEVGAASVLVERLGPVRLRFASQVDEGGTTLRLLDVGRGPVRLGRGVRIDAHAITTGGELTTTVKMQIGRGRIGRLEYTSRLSE